MGYKKLSAEINRKQHILDVLGHKSWVKINLNGLFVGKGIYYYTITFQKCINV